MYKKSICYPTPENVKLLGRTYLLGNTLWLAYSASGIEFTFTGIQAEVKLIGDNIATSIDGEEHFCRIGIFVNDNLIIDDLINEPEKIYPIFESYTKQNVSIKIIKLSETSDSTVGIGEITITADEPITPTKPALHRVEFIGDSITCGFGVEDNDRTSPFRTSTENVLKSFAYQTAQAFHADYSMVSISGYGIITGYTETDEKLTDKLLPIYYDRMGFSHGYFNGNTEVSSIEWDFSRFIPELIVINLGTNDSSYCKNIKTRQEDFIDGYVRFLKHVRGKNPDAVILCTLGIMGDILYPSVEEAANRYIADTKDSKVFTMKFDEQLESDGYGALWHPSQITQTKAAAKLTNEIECIMGWPIYR